MAFLQWFEIADEDTLPLDDIYKTFQCVRLRWHRTSDETDVLSSAAEHGLVPLDSLWGFVHLARRDFMVDDLDKLFQRKVKKKRLRKGKEGWPSQLLYVNCYLTCISTRRKSRISLLRVLDSPVC